MSCIEKIKHDVSWCTAEKGLQTFYDDGKNKFTGFCFSCASKGLEAYVANPYEDGVRKEPPKKKPKEETEAEIAEIRALQYPNFVYRGIDKQYLRQAGVRMAFSEFDGKTPNSLCYPFTLDGKLVGYKVKIINKKIMWSVGETKGADLFNWEIAKKKGVKRLYVTEGEEDCLSLEQILDEGGKGQYKHAVVSLVNGANSAASTLGRMRKEIEEIFSEVVLVFDQDEAGENAVREVQKVWPSILEAPHVTGIKDANDALNSKHKATFFDFVRWKARKPPIQGVVTVSQTLEKGVKPPEIGLSYPWEELTKVLYGQKFGEAICIAGAVSSGKTLLAHEVAAWNMTQHKLPCFAALLEEQNFKTLWNIAAKIDSIPYNKPEVYEANREQFEATISSLEDKLFLWNSQGNSSSRFDMEEIIAAIRFNALEYGIKSAFIDNMTRLTDHLSTGEANEFINKYSSEIANLAEELNINIFLYSHLNPPKGKDARSHEEGAEIFPSQLTGSRGVMRSFPTILGFERNQFAEGNLANNSFISILKNRDYGGKKKIKTQYSPTTGRLLEFNWNGESLY